ncbi:hypothetical protein T492DRAFT_831811 [Pavlovales sp. CCMP2436]|nr:hypothetical protein T492DRAFT_831811 [Pavlovales sp. CCMP2436]
MASRLAQPRSVSSRACGSAAMRLTARAAQGRWVDAGWVTAGLETAAGAERLVDGLGVGAKVAAGLCAALAAAGCAAKLNLALTAEGRGAVGRKERRKEEEGSKEGRRGRKVGWVAVCCRKKAHSNELRQESGGRLRRRQPNRNQKRRAELRCSKMQAAGGIGGRQEGRKAGWAGYCKQVGLEERKEGRRRGRKEAGRKVGWVAVRCRKKSHSNELRRRQPTRKQKRRAELQEEVALTAEGWIAAALEIQEGGGLGWLVSRAWVRKLDSEVGHRAEWSGGHLKQELRQRQPTRRQKRRTELQEYVALTAEGWIAVSSSKMQAAGGIGGRQEGGGLGWLVSRAWVSKLDSEVGCRAGWSGGYLKQECKQVGLDGRKRKGPNEGRRAAEDWIAVSCSKMRAAGSIESSVSRTDYLRQQWLGCIRMASVSCKQVGGRMESEVEGGIGDKAAGWAAKHGR